MLTHPDLMLAEMNYRQREMIAEADRARLLATARRRRRRAGFRRPDGTVRPAAPGRPDGTLAACEPRVVAPAR